ncbi:hypothetical protein [Streptomyces sp. NPDC097619]|uniref:hypothetical protein n=1 Tax=Streptomyces sp. NPDC097619 TaxID=3157228 RepID=UPI003317E752
MAVWGLLSLVAAVAGCGGDGDRGEAVYGRPLAAQLRAAVAETRAAGTGAFTATVEYHSPSTTARHRTTGTVDFARGTARAELTREVPPDFPVDAVPRLDQDGGGRPQTLAAAGPDVFARGADGVWLRFDPAAREALDPKGRAPVSRHAPGRFLPLGGTLAELVATAVPRREPLRRKDGAREYAVSVPLGDAHDLLPLRPPKPTGGAYLRERLPLTVVLDPDGRLLSADLDMLVLLEQLNGGPQSQRGLPGVTGLRATFRFDSLGEPAGAAAPPAAVPAAGAVTELRGRPRGTCAVPAAGLDAPGRVRTVDCAARHTMRVFAAASTPDADRTTAARYVEQTCDGPYAALPAAWKRGAEEPYGHLLTIRQGSFRFRFDAAGRPVGPPPKLAMGVVCYVSTP